MVSQSESSIQQPFGLIVNLFYVSWSELVLISVFCLSPSVPATALQHRTLRGSSGLGPCTSHPGCPDAVSVCTPTQVIMEMTVCLTRLFTTALPSAVTSECSLSMKIGTGLFRKNDIRIRPIVQWFSNPGSRASGGLRDFKYRSPGWFKENVCTVSLRSEYTPHICVNILLYIFMWQHWRNYTLLQCKVVSVQLV